MKNKLINITLILFLLNGCVGASSKGVFGTGVSVAPDPRTVGTQIDD
jgi:osmotically-inducible protein OsmY